MNRILILLAATLLFHGVDAHAGVVSEKRWKQYETWAKAIYPEQDVALAVAPNGSNCSSYGRGQAQAKANALRCCKTSQHNSSNASCKIVDVNFKSRTRSSSTASTSGKSGWCSRYPNSFVCQKKTTTVSTSGSKSVWCAKKDYIYKSASANCHSGGKAFAFKFQAQAEHQRLKNQ